MRRMNRWRWVPIFVLCSFTFACKNNQPTETGAASSAVASEVNGQENDKKAVRLRIPNYPLETAQDLDVLLKEIGDARIVLLGEASHGTSEYYTWRAALSKRLIQEKGFDFIAVEGEWADSYRVNNFIKGERQDSAATVQLLRQYNRWPTWMWGNYEVASLVNWLNAYNHGKADTAKAGFFGLDVYCLWESMTELMPYIQNADASIVQSAQKVHQCFQPYSDDPQQYAMAVADAGANCRAEVSQLWRRIERQTSDSPAKSEAEFVAEQNALVALNGERYYRTMVSSSSESWNIRDRHMAETLRRLLAFHGPDSKAIVWEHNTHVGDARYTDMTSQGEVNVGQLVRKEFGEENVFIVGAGSYSGTVIAAGGWGAPIKTIQVPPATPGSWEQILHQLSPKNKIILSKDLQDSKYLKRPIGHRAIGVVYNPQLEHLGNYVPSIIPKRYDAFLYIDTSKALHPIDMSPTENEPPDLYPWGT